MSAGEAQGGVVERAGAAALLWEALREGVVSVFRRCDEYLGLGVDGEREYFITRSH